MKPSPLAGKIVLVVDDEEDLRSALIFDFRRRGCKVFEAANGVEALAIVFKESVDLVISDVRMPEGNGIELLREIRKHNKEIPIVLLATGFADLSEPEALSMGAQALLEKPIDRKKMLEIVEQSVA